MLKHWAIFGEAREKRHSPGWAQIACIPAVRAKAAVNRTQSRRSARFEGLHCARSVWIACILAPLFECGGVRPAQKCSCTGASGVAKKMARWLAAPKVELFRKTVQRVSRPALISSMARSRCLETWGCPFTSALSCTFASKSLASRSLSSESGCTSCSL